MTARAEKGRPILPRKSEMEKEAEKHVYPKDSGKYNIHTDKEGFYERALDEKGMEIEYVPLPKDLPPSVRKSLEEERKKKGKK